MGAGRGHVSKLARVARAIGPHATLLAALSSRLYAHELGLPAADILQCPALAAHREDRAAAEQAGNATFACYLAACGLVHADTLRRSLNFWRTTIVDRNVSVLVADYAPLALWAARGLAAEGWEIRTICIGTGYGVPPAHLPRFGQLLPGRDRIVHPEEQTLALLNRTADDLNLPPLPGLAALYQADLSLAATFRDIDPYQDIRNQSDRMPPMVSASSALSAGEEVFVYLSTTEMERPALIAALEALPLPRRGYLPGASDATRSRLRAAGMIVESAPVSADLIAARSRLILHAAQHGTLCMAALAGLPQLAMPGHQEQWVHALAAREAGLLETLSGRDLSAAEITEKVMTVHADAVRTTRAHDLARHLRSACPVDPEADLAARLAPELAAARAFLTA
jgi:hypothetical protein